MPGCVLQAAHQSHFSVTSFQAQTYLHLTGRCGDQDEGMEEIGVMFLLEELFLSEDDPSITNYLERLHPLLGVTTYNYLVIYKFLFFENKPRTASTKPFVVESESLFSESSQYQYLCVKSCTKNKPSDS
ncbi:unnamed protein product [Amoebophrya sp. A120]|nr:unnamed protein product [Amoebophrya sp. A120]|eukprot:GSA120T00019647001.1